MTSKPPATGPAAETDAQDLTDSDLVGVGGGTLTVQGKTRIEGTKDVLRPRADGLVFNDSQKE